MVCTAERADVDTAGRVLCGRFCNYNARNMVEECGDVTT